MFDKHMSEMREERCPKRILDWAPIIKQQEKKYKTEDQETWL